MPETDARLAVIREWLSHDLRLPYERLLAASSDASFRRYFRVFTPRGTYIVMDAPPGREDVRPYLKVGALLASLGAHVPQVHDSDVARGLLLLEDLGTSAYLQRLARLRPMTARRSRVSLRSCRNGFAARTWALNPRLLSRRCWLAHLSF